MYVCFGGHIGRDLGHLHFQPIATTIDRFPDLGIIEIDSSIIFCS